MYTYTIFCFGHQMSNNEELNNKLADFDIEFGKKINNRKWEIDFPYHGGQVAGDCQSCIFGTQISVSDSNPYFVNEVRGAKESDYIDDYNIFLQELFSDLDNNIQYVLETDEETEYKELIDELKKFCSENKADFYSVEASS